MCDETVSGTQGSPGSPKEPCGKPCARRRIVLTPGLPSKKLLEKIILHLRGGDAEDRAAAFYLREFEERNEHKLYKYPTLAKFAEARLGLPERDAQELIRIERKLQGLPALDEAFARGEIGWSKLRELTRIATAETEEAWILYAKAKTTREVERAVARSKKGAPPPKDGEDLGTPRTRFRVSYELTPRAKTDWETALEKVFAEFPKDTPVSEIFSHIAETMIRTPRRPGENAKLDPVHTIVYHVRAGKAWVEFNEGAVEIPLSEALEAAARGRVIEVEDPQEGVGDTILFGERGSVPEEERDPPASKALRTAVSARESHRCAACRRRVPLMTHHIKARAKGGKTRMAVLLSLCGPCHGMLHDGLLRIEVAPGGRIEIRDREGNLGGEISAADGLSPEDLVVVERAASAERSLEEPAAPENGAPPEGAKGLDATPPEGSKNPTWGFLASQVLVPPHPPSSELTQIEDAGSIADLPPRISPEGWRALSGRLEWSASRNAFTYHRHRECSRPAALPGDEEEKEEEPPPGDHRPHTLSDVVGQERAVSNLARAARAAAERGEVLPHTLLVGPPGVGKTSLAEAVAREMKARLRTAMGNMLVVPSLIVTLLSSLRRGDALFIDEIHSLPLAVTECLHSAIEDRVLDITLTEGSETAVLRLALEPFTLIGATTRPGKLPEPFRARFRIEETLDCYPLESLAEIARRAAERLGLEASLEATLEVARRSRRTPREAIRLVERARDFAQARRSRALELPDVLDAGRSFRIDAYGLREDERRILAFLIERRCAVGLETIAATLRLDARTVKAVHEPYLLEQGLIVRTSRGREATAKAREVVEKVRREEEGSAAIA